MGWEYKEEAGWTGGNGRAKVPTPFHDRGGGTSVGGGRGQEGLGRRRLRIKDLSP